MESESAKVELIVSRFFSKCIHVLLQSRYNNNAVVEKVNSDVTPEDKWFNLLLTDLPPKLIRNAGVCCSTQFVVDFVLLHRDGNGYLHSKALEPSWESNWRWDGKGGKVIERWVMIYEGNKGMDHTRCLKGSSMSKTFYKKCVLMLRSLYLMIKLLPTYKLFRDLTASREPCEFTLGHHIASFAEPFRREEEAQMHKYLFDPIETSCGSLCLSVLYLSSLVDLTSKLPSYQILPHIIIPDYCGGISVDPVCTAPKLHVNRMVTYGSKSSCNDRKPPLTPKTAGSAERQWPTAKAASSTSPSCSRSHFLDSPFHLAKTCPRASTSSGSLDCLRSEVGNCQNPRELGDPFQPKLSDNAALGSMFSIFHTAAPLRQNSAFTPNNNLHAKSVTVQANPTIKTALDALSELQDHIETKNRILQRKSIKTPNSLGYNAATKSSPVPN